MPLKHFPSVCGMSYGLQKGKIGVDLGGICCTNFHSSCIIRLIGQMGDILQCLFQTIIRLPHGRLQLGFLSSNLFTFDLTTTLDIFGLTMSLSNNNPSPISQASFELLLIELLTFDLKVKTTLNFFT